MGDMADMELMNCLDQEEMFSRYCNAPGHIQYEHGLCDEMGYMYSTRTYKLDRGPGLCPKCKADTVLRHGKYGDFYGCSTFPMCKGSRCFK